MVREWKPPARDAATAPRRAPLHDRHIDARQSQLTGQHHSGRTAPHDDHICHVVPFS